MSERTARTCLRIFLAICSVAATDASARIFKLTHLGGALEAGVEISHQETESENSEPRTFDRYRFTEAIELDVAGYIVSSELLNFQLGGIFGPRQEILKGDSGSGDTNSMLFGYNGTMNLFPSKPISLLLFASRFEDQLIQSFGANTDSLGDTLGATLRLGNVLFPSTISVQQLHTRFESKDSSSFENRRDETRRFVEYNGSHNSEAWTARVTARAEDVDDESVPPVGDYRVYAGDATASHRWGSFYEKHLRLSGGYFERQGNFSFRNASQNAAFYWGLTDRLNSSLEQNFDFSDSDGEESTTYMTVFSLDHELYESLRTNFNALYERTGRDFGVRTSYGTNLDLNYEKRIPWNSIVSLDLGARYRYEDRAFDGVRTINTSENLAITGTLGNFLSNRNIDPDSIEVFESAGGVQLLEGVDYTVDVVGDLTSIDIPFTSPVEIGDELFVNYVYLSDPSAKISRPGFRIAAAWDAGWLALRFEHVQSEEMQLAGEEQPLQFLRRDSIRLDLRAERGQFEGAASAEYLNDETRSTGYDEIAFGQELRWQPRRGVYVSAVARESQRFFRRPKREMRTITLGVSAFWQITPTSTLRVFGNFRDMHNSVAQDQRDAGLGARANLRFGRIEVIPSLVWTRRQRGQSLSNDLRSVLRLRRSF